jgi:hypothetical protein
LQRSTLPDAALHVGTADRIFLNKRLFLYLLRDRRERGSGLNVVEVFNHIVRE